MDLMKNHFIIKANPKALEKNLIQGDCYRITVLTDCLLRLEYSAGGHFVDEPTQIVWNRDFQGPSYQLMEEEDRLELITEKLHLIYNKKEFTSHGLSIQVKGREIWHYGQEPENLGGTARTLDKVDGACDLENGLLSRSGYAVLDDSRSLLLGEDGWAMPRREPELDLYFFGYGHDYRGALKDFYSLCGKTPMLPRYALGNWWSRYYAYTQESYKALMERFRKEELPFTVGVLDMDWHLVDIDPKYGNGWTGYTWNRELFPDPEGLLCWLHEKGIHVTMNVHPADGIRAHEERYPQMAEAMGVDAKKELPVNFDVGSCKFMENYFEIMHHPLEEEGVDFWWIDWQQGTHSSVPGLDPLWMLNHYHFLDSGRDGKRPMTFSRYAGPGSHRYPVGFSGDTIVTWESLDFQPYFTSTASNMGYGWWSHDIGGHMHGYRNDELETRWMQYGVFSPIMRLHSTNNEFNGKEPWRFPEEKRQVMNEFLRLRHRLIPYLYTMNYRSWKEGAPLVAPLYYDYPEQEEAYQVKNGYFFGTELLVFPATTPRIAGINQSETTGWLPKGIYTDMFTGMIYESTADRTMSFFRGLDSIPVLAKAGAIVPVTDEISSVQAGRNPESLRIRIYPGADNTFLLYEDDNETCGYEHGECAVTSMKLCWEGVQSFCVGQVEGNAALIPEHRDYVLEFWGVKDAQVKLLENGEPRAFEKTYDSFRNVLTVTVLGHPSKEKLELFFETPLELGDNHVKERLHRFLDQAEISFDLKVELTNLAEKETSPLKLAGELYARGLDQSLLGVLLELLCAKE